MLQPLFLCHGGPTLVIEDNSYTDFLKEYGRTHRPKAILVFSAHWESAATKISSIQGTYDMIYDFSGFQKELYEIQYPAKGDPELANRVSKLFDEKGVSWVLDERRGLDHASWDILYLMYPQADIPVVQLSIHPFMDKEQLFQIGEALKELQNEDILIIGSGSTVHNLGTVDWSATKPEDWAVAFDDWLLQAVEAGDRNAMIDYRQQAPSARVAVPREEHLVPLFIAMGAGQKEHPTTLHRSYVYGTLSYIALEF